MPVIIEEKEEEAEMAKALEEICALHALLFMY